MASLYVDVDFTLIDWTYEGSAPKPTPRQGTINFVREWRLRHPDGFLVIWSLGGKGYAQEWGHKLFPGMEFAASDRYAKSCGFEELFIDDDPFDSYKAQTIHPDWLRGNEPRTLDPQRYEEDTNDNRP